METQYWRGQSGAAVAPVVFASKRVSLTAPRPIWASWSQTHPSDEGPIQEDILAYELPPLPYDYAALEPHIDTETMKLHHDQHHPAYVNHLHGAIDNHPPLRKHPPDAL